MTQSRYPKIIFFFYIFFLSACGGGSVPPVEPNPPAPEQSAALPENTGLEPGEPVQFTYQVTNDPGSRWQDITITITDENGNPVSDLEIAYNQIDIDFYFDSSNCPQCAWTEIENNEYQWNIKQKPNAKELIHEYLDVGFNAEVGYFGIWWKDAEPENNKWNPFFCQFNEEVNYPCIGAVQGEIWQEEPTENRFYYADLGPDFRYQHNVNLWKPEWLNIDDETNFKKEFEEYIAEIIKRGDLNLGGYDYYMIGYESAGGSDLLPWSNTELYSDQMVDEWADFFDWEIKTIRKYDPEAIIGLNLHNIGWDRDHMDLPENMAPQPYIEALIALEAEFEIIGFEIHPGASSCEGDSREFNQHFLDTFKKYGKKIYIWEYGVTSRGSLPVEDWCKDWDYSVDAMDEKYQDRVFMEIFDIFFQDPQVVGIRILDYIDKPLDMRDQEDLWTREVDLGLINQDGTKKPVYDSLNNYWHSQFSSSSATTDENGQITFNAIPGLFEITVAGKTVTAHFYTEDSIFAREEGDMIVLLNAEMTLATPPPTLDESAEVESPMDDNLLSPCDLSKDMIGQEVTVVGQIQFVDQGGEGVFFELEDQGCRSGAFVMKSDWNQWSEEVQSNIQPGMIVEVTGFLGEFQGELELEILGPPIFLN